MEPTTVPAVSLCRDVRAVAVRGSWWGAALACLLFIAAWMCHPCRGGERPASGTLHRVERLLQGGDLKKAERLLSSLGDELGESPEYHKCRVRLYLKKGRKFQAFHALKDLLAIRPGHPWGVEVFGKLLPLLLAEVKKTLVRAPDAPSYEVFGFILVLEGRVEAGCARLRKAIELDPLFPHPYDDLAWVFYERGKMKKALEYSSKALNLAPLVPAFAWHYKYIYADLKAGRRRPSVAFYPVHREVEPQGGGDGAGGSPSAGAGSSIEVSGPTSSAAATAGSTPAGAGGGEAPSGTGRGEQERTSGGMLVDFTKVDVGDDELVAELLESAAGSLSVPAASPASAAGEEEGDATAAGRTSASTSAVVVPTPLAVLKKLDSLYTRALEAEKAGRYEEALKLQESVFALEDGYKDTAERVKRLRRIVETLESYERVEELLDLRQYDQVLALCRGLDRALLEELGKDPSRLDRAEALALYGRRRFSSAVPKLRRWYEEHPSDTLVGYELARALYELGRYKEAWRLLRTLRDSIDGKILERYPDHQRFELKVMVKAHFEWLVAFAVLWFVTLLGYLGFKLYKGAEANRKRRLFDGLSSLLRSHSWEELLQTAREGLSSGLELSEVERYRLRYAAAVALLGLGRMEEAGEAAERLVEEYPEDALGRQLMGRVFLAARRVDDHTAPFLEELLAADPNNVECLKALCDYYAGRPEKREEYRKVLVRLCELEPSAVDSLSRLAELMMEEGEADAESLAVYRRALAANPSDRRLRHAYARALFEQGEIVEALRECERSLEDELDDERLHGLLVECYRRLEMFEEGVRRYKQWLKRHELPVLKECLEALKEGEEEYRKRKQGLDEKEDLFFPYFDKGVRLYGEGRFEEAVGPLQTAMNSSSQLGLQAGALLVKTYLRLGDTEAAKLVFDKLDLTSLESPPPFVMDLCYEMAGVYAAEKDIQRAHELYNYICRHDVGYKDAFERLEKLRDEHM